MHASAYKQMARCVERYMPKDRHYVVVDFGSYSAKRSLTVTHRLLLSDHDCDITGVDIRPGHNVDVVMKKPYRLPMKSKSVDVVMSGQVFEHIPFFWASMLEIARVLKPGGHLLMTVPSRGHVHTPVDCWRYYPDGIRAMAAFAGLEAREARTQFPPKRGRRLHYQSIEDEHYWGDTVGVFRKPERYPSAQMAIVRPPLLWWANRAAGRMQRRPRRRKGSQQSAAVQSHATVGGAGKTPGGR